MLRCSRWTIIYVGIGGFDKDMFDEDRDNDEQLFKEQLLNEQLNYGPSVI